MPRRKGVLATGEIYHVYNRALDGREVFVGDWLQKRAVKALWFFRCVKRGVSFSRYLEMTRSLQMKVEETLENDTPGVEVLAYCLMRNHYHLLVRQTSDGAISKYVADVQNSYTRYYNTREGRKGSLFESQFRAKRIETDEQLLHVSRYIHINPYAGYLMARLEELPDYRYSSLVSYIGKQDGYKWLQHQPIMEHFQDGQAYWVFVRDHAEYQRSLQRYKHLFIEESNLSS